MGERLPLPHHLSCCCNAARTFKPVSENLRGRHISLHDAQNCSSACNPAAAALGRFSSPPHRELYNSLMFFRSKHVCLSAPSLSLFLGATHHLPPLPPCVFCAPCSVFCNILCFDCVTFFASLCCITFCTFLFA